MRIKLDEVLCEAIITLGNMILFFPKLLFKIILALYIFSEYKQLKLIAEVQLFISRHSDQKNLKNLLCR